MDRRHCQPTGRSPPRCRAFAGIASSTRFAVRTGMTRFSAAMQPLVNLVSRVFGRLVAMIVGFVLTAVGLGMMVTIVLLPGGVVLGLLGVAIFVGGLFAPDPRAEQARHL